MPQVTTSEKQKALYTLRTRMDVIIKKPDKGLAMVVMSFEDYIAKVMHRLNDTQYYHMPDDNQTGQFADKISGFLNDMLKHHIVEETTMRSLWLENAKPSQFYVLPKIHKSGNPGRPIVSSCGVPIEGILWFVEYHLHPLVGELPSYIKDTTDFLLKLQTINNLPSDVLQPPTKDLIHIIKLILTCNNFIFENSTTCNYMGWPLVLQEDCQDSGDN